MLGMQTVNTVIPPSAVLALTLQPSLTILQGDLATGLRKVSHCPEMAPTLKLYHHITAERPHTPTPCSALHIYNTQSNNFKIHPNVVK